MPVIINKGERVIKEKRCKKEKYFEYMLTIINQAGLRNNRQA